MSDTLDEISPKSSTPLMLLSANVVSSSCSLFIKVIRSSRLSTTAVTAFPIIAGIFLLKNNSLMDPVFPNAVSAKVE